MDSILGVFTFKKREIWSYSKIINQMQVMKKENLLTWIYSQLTKTQLTICQVIRVKSRNTVITLLKILKSSKIFWLQETLLKKIMNKNKNNNKRSNKIKKKKKMKWKKKRKNFNIWKNTWKFKLMILIYILLLESMVLKSNLMDQLNNV